jgi:hypothetical protein
MRAEQERLTKQVDYWVHRHDELQMLARNNRETVSNVARILGESFIGLPPVTRLVQRIEHNYRMPERMPLDRLLECSPDDAKREMVAGLLHIIECRPLHLRSQIDDMRRLIHMRLETPDGQIGYALTDDAWLQMRNDRRIVEYLGEMVASELAQHFRSKPTAHWLGERRP